MATIADKLTTIAGIKTDIRTAINGKGGSLTSGSPFSAYSAAISSLPSGGGGYPPDWSQIGYTSTPQLVLDAFSHAKTIYDNWDPTVTRLNGKFSGDKSLVYLPIVDTSRATSMDVMFYGCTNLTYVPLLDTSSCTSMNATFAKCESISDVPQFDTSSVTNMQNMFSGATSLATTPSFNTSACTNMYGTFANCKSITGVPQFDTSKVTSMHFMFFGCSGLTSMPQFNTSACTDMAYWVADCSGLTSIPALETGEVTNMDHMFNNCTSLKRITSLDMGKCTNFNSMVGGFMGNLRFILLKGLGTPSGVTSYRDANMYDCTNWGVNSTEIPDARQSLVDSLLTYSFDRAAAGYATCTIQLSRNSYSQLTPQELADIQAKGYTIS